MTFPFSDVVSASGSLDRAVLLSERTQLIAIKALQVAENRSSWNEMSDSDWDTLEDYVADALTEILTIQEQPSMTAQLKQASRGTSQAIAVNTDTAIVWTSGDYHGGGASGDTILAPIDGVAIITAWVQYLTATTSQFTAWLVVNGVEYARQDSDAVRLGHMRQLSFVVPVTNQDTINVVVRANVAGNIVQTNGDTRINIAFLPVGE